MRKIPRMLCREGAANPPMKQSVSMGAEHERTAVVFAASLGEQLTDSPPGFTTHSFCDLDKTPLGFGPFL